MDTESRLFNCYRCFKQVFICRNCDRGNIYCPPCAQQARIESKRKANARYQKTFRGRLNHAHCQKRYRQRQEEKKAQARVQEKNRKQKIVMEQGSDGIPILTSYQPVLNEGTQKIKKQDHYYCSFCKKEMSLLMRFDFLNHSAKREKRGSIFPAGP